jgi:hypothetical protein
VAFVSACTFSAAAAQVRPDTAQQAGKVPPKPASKIDPGAGKLDGKLQPNAQQSSKHLPTDAKLSGKHDPIDESGLTRKLSFDRGMTATAAEKAYATARLDEIDRIVLEAVPEIGHLSYPMSAHRSGFFASAPKSSTILQYDYELVADLGHGNYCAIFTASINHAASGTEEPWPQGPHGKPIPGVSFVLAELVPPPDPSYEQMFIVRDGEVPYRQVTREEVRRWQIIDEEGVNGEKLAKARQRVANTPYERFMAEAPERKKMRDEARAALKGLRTPAEIDAQIKLMEDAEREAAAQLKAQEKEDRQQNDSISHAQSTADKARASIARMSAAERKLPAWVKPEASDTLYTFGTAETPYGARMIRVNPEFWTMHRSRVEVRSIDLDFSARCPKQPPPPEVHRALWKLRQNIDWAALKKMVNEQR